MMKKQRIPIIANIESFSHEGRGIARVNGKTTFIAGALPGEKVTFLYTRQKKDFDEGVACTVENVSPHRIAPHCQQYDRCGGCSLQHLNVETQIHEKETFLLNLLMRVGHCQPRQVLPPLQSPHWHYRHKARLSVRYVEKKQTTMVGFREKHNPRFITEIDQCVILNERVSANLLGLRALIGSMDNPHSIAQVEIAAGDKDIALIFRHLKPLSTMDEEKLRDFSEQTHFLIYLQAGGPSSVALFHPPQAHAFLSYTLPAYGLNFEFHPTDFTQINPHLNQLMVTQALSLMDLNPEDKVLDLFCGLGNFSLPISKFCEHVTGIEGNTEMVERAITNARQNHCNNTTFIAANLENDNVFDSFKTSGISKILLDPPRTGAFNLVKQISTIHPQRIVYVSCNPATLARDANILVNQEGYILSSTGVMDMFPHTAHVESIALFERQ